MELSPKSLRAAHLFTRMEIIRSKHKGSYDCVICDDGGSSIYWAFKKYEELLIELANERKEALRKCGSKEDEVKKSFEERRQKLLQEFPLHLLRGVWTDIFEMIQEEGLEQRYFVDWCREYFQAHPNAHKGCYFASSGWEGWLYRAAKPNPVPEPAPKQDPYFSRGSEGGDGPIW